VIFCENLPQAPAPAIVLSILRDSLALSGVLNLTVPARPGRFAVRLLADLLGSLGTDPGPGGLARVRRAIDSLPASHSVRKAIAGHPELGRDDGLAEALRSGPDFTVLELLDLLEQSGLAFQRFLCQAPYLPQCSRLASLAELTPRIAALPALRQLAVTELFRGSLLAHTVLACRDDRPRSSFDIGFTGEDWLRLIPIRNPGLAIETLNLPEAAAARLRWHVHDDPEICLLLADDEARLFDAMDGVLTISQILETVEWARTPTALARARDLFDGLWSRDYVWFRFRPASAEKP
jgi:hypothetical protein